MTVDAKGPVWSSHASADHRPAPALTTRSSIGLSSEDSSMNPRVSISPLRSDDVPSSSKKSDRGRTTGRVKRSNKGKVSSRDRPSSGSGFEKSKPWSDSDDDGKVSDGSEEKDGSDVPASRRRSRNIQLTSLFDSLSGFFSADSDRRRRTAYVNATVSLAQSSLNPRHSFTGLQQPLQATQRPTNQKSLLQATAQPTNQKTPPLQATAQPTNQKARRTSSKPTSFKTRPQHITPATQKARKPPSKLLTPTTTERTEVKPQSRRGRSTKSLKTVKRPAESSAGKDDVTKSSMLRPADGDAEMRDLMTTSVAESESKLFHTAQTIAQQVIIY